MDSNDSGPPPRKRFMNGNREGLGRTSESRDSSEFRGRPGRGIRGKGFIRGRGAFRGGFRGRGSSRGRGGYDSFREHDSGNDAAEGSTAPYQPRGESSDFRGRGSSPFRGRGMTPFRGRGRSNSFSGHDDTPGFRGGRGSFGFRGRGSSPGFRGRGAPGFRGRGAPGFRGRGGAPTRGFHQAKHILTIYNLPAEKSFQEQQDLVKDMVAGYNCLDVYLKVSQVEDHFSKATCLLGDGNSLRKACEELNGRCVDSCQLLCTGVNRYYPTKPLVIMNLPDKPTLKDLMEVLHDCKGIADISPFNLKASPPYIFVFVSNDEDVDRIMSKSSTSIRGSEIDIRCLDPACVARSPDTHVNHERWRDILDTDTELYIYKTIKFTDIYFQSQSDLDKNLKKVADLNKQTDEKIVLHRRLLHECFYAEICDVDGEVNDVELYSLIRKHGEVSVFKRLDKDHYFIRQELSAAMAAMNLSDSKGCGGMLKFSWHNTREKNASSQPKEKKKKKKNKKAKKAEIDSKTVEDAVKDSAGDDEMVEDEGSGEFEDGASEAGESVDDEAEYGEDDVGQEDAEEELQDNDDDAEEELEGDDAEEELEGDEEEVVVKKEPLEDDDDDSDVDRKNFQAWCKNHPEPAAPTNKKSKKNKNKAANAKPQQPQPAQQPAKRENKAGRSRKRKISTA